MYEKVIILPDNLMLTVGGRIRAGAPRARSGSTGQPCFASSITRFVRNAGKLTRIFGSRVTPHREAIRQTLKVLRPAGGCPGFVVPGKVWRAPRMGTIL